MFYIVIAMVKVARHKDPEVVLCRMAVTIEGKQYSENSSGERYYAYMSSCHYVTASSARGLIRSFQDDKRLSEYEIALLSVDGVQVDHSIIISDNGIVSDSMLHRGLTPVFEQSARGYTYYPSVQKLFPMQVARKITLAEFKNRYLKKRDLPRPEDPVP